jgi:enoyl-CoA hydratase/carnithine racemase
VAIRYEVKDTVAVVTIDRQEVANAVDHETAMQLVDAFERFDADTAAHIAVLTGAGKNFCAGGDLKAILDGRGVRVLEDGPGPLGPTRMLLSKPVIAAVEGNAVAGGLELALWCDLRVAARDATFGVYCRRWGVPLCDGGTVRLPRLVGQSRALDMILTGRGVGGEEGAAMGLVNRLCEPGQAIDTALKLAAALSRLPQRCLRSDRLSAYEQWTLPLDEALGNETRRGREVISSPEMFQGVRGWRSGERTVSDFPNI